MSMLRSDKSLRILFVIEGISKFIYVFIIDYVILYNFIKFVLLSF